MAQLRLRLLIGLSCCLFTGACNSIDTSRVDAGEGIGYDSVKSNAKDYPPGDYDADRRFRGQFTLSLSRRQPIPYPRRKSNPLAEFLAADELLSDVITFEHDDRNPANPTVTFVLQGEKSFKGELLVEEENRLQLNIRSEVEMQHSNLQDLKAYIHCLGVIDESDTLDLPCILGISAENKEGEIVRATSRWRYSGLLKPQAEADRSAHLDLMVKSVGGDSFEPYIDSIPMHFLPFRSAGAETDSVLAFGEDPASGMRAVLGYSDRELFLQIIRRPRGDQNRQHVDLDCETDRDLFDGEDELQLTCEHDLSGAQLRGRLTATRP